MERHDNQKESNDKSHTALTKNENVKTVQIVALS